MGGHSKGAGSAAITYGNGVTYYNSMSLSRPELLRQIKERKNINRLISTFGKAEHLHELNLVMPKVDIVLENLDNMAKHADRVNIFMLRDDKHDFPNQYGDRRYEALTDKLKDKKIPNNVNIIEIKNFAGTEHHGGALEKGSPVLEQIFKQYEEIQNKAGDK